jgi:hypothetical protein
VLLLLLLLLLLPQIHVRGGEVMYFSRRGREHGRLSDYIVFDEVVRRQVGGDDICNCGNARTPGGSGSCWPG